MEIVAGQPLVDSFLRSEYGTIIQSCMKDITSKQCFCLFVLLEIGQEHVLEALCGDIDSSSYSRCIRRLAESVERIEEFYDSIGGVAGYQLQCLKIISKQNGYTNSTDEVLEDSKVEMHIPKGLDLESPEAMGASMVGINEIGRMAEIYPLGGAGDRLGLQCEETGDSLPTAVLPYCGRSLLENLIRDIQGREYLHFCLYDKQHTIPVAVMTSLAKGNHKRVVQLFEANNWFGRSKESFRLFQQPMVPMVEAQNGKWILSGPLEVIMKPGGHGVIWKLMYDNGIFDWFKEQNKDAAIVRQISNPMAGQDNTLFALAGEGLQGKKAFGFASCERVAGAAEGMNVMLRETVRGRDGKRKTFCRITNVEYTEFQRLGIEDKSEHGSQFSPFPANTNVLYLGIPHVEQVVRRGIASGTTETILPGMILNLKKEVAQINITNGLQESIPAGRLECTMQNLADCFGVETLISDIGCKDSPRAADNLPTFLVFGPRRKVTSSAKRKRKPGSLKIHQTPDGSFYDLQQSARNMLTLCGMQVPEIGSVDKYLADGPGFIFLFHPALGPLWDVVAQKIQGGKIAHRSEVQIEVAEACIHDLEVSGSFLIEADAPLGKSIDRNVIYSRRECSRIYLNNVKVRNEGIDWSNPHNVYWRHRVVRKQCCKIHLQGRSEFEAHDVDLEGELNFVVPDGQRMVVRQGPRGPEIEMHPLGHEPSWKYEYQMDGNRIILNRFQSDMNF